MLDQSYFEATVLGVVADMEQIGLDSVDLQSPLPHNRGQVVYLLNQRLCDSLPKPVSQTIFLKKNLTAKDLAAELFKVM